MNNRNAKAHLVKFGLGGHTVYCTQDAIGRVGERSKFSIQGYDSPERFLQELAANQKSSYPNLLHTPCIDARQAYRKNPGLSLRSPMLCPLLQPGAVEHMPEPTDVMLHGLTGLYKVIALARKAAPEFSGWDTVSVADYLIWMKRHGGDDVRLGFFDTETTITWEEDNA